MSMSNRLGSRQLFSGVAVVQHQHHQDPEQDPEQQHREDLLSESSAASEVVVVGGLRSSRSSGASRLLRGGDHPAEAVTIVSLGGEGVEEIFGDLQSSRSAASLLLRGEREVSQSLGRSFGAELNVSWGLGSGGLGLSIGSDSDTTSQHHQHPVETSEGLRNLLAACREDAAAPRRTETLYRPSWADGGGGIEIVPFADPTTYEGIAISDSYRLASSASSSATSSSAAAALSPPPPPAEVKTTKRPVGRPRKMTATDAVPLEKKPKRTPKAVASKDSQARWGRAPDAQTRASEYTGYCHNVGCDHSEGFATDNAERGCRSFHKHFLRDIRDTVEPIVRRLLTAQATATLQDLCWVALSACLLRDGLHWQIIDDPDAGEHTDPWTFCSKKYSWVRSSNLGNRLFKQTPAPPPANSGRVLPSPRGLLEVLFDASKSDLRDKFLPLVRKADQVGRQQHSSSPTVSTAGFVKDLGVRGKGKKSVRLLEFNTTAIQTALTVALSTYDVGSPELSSSGVEDDGDYDDDEDDTDPSSESSGSRKGNGSRKRKAEDSRDSSSQDSSADERASKYQRTEGNSDAHHKTFERPTSTSVSRSSTSSVILIFKAPVQDVGRFSGIGLSGNLLFPTAEVYSEEQGSDLVECLGSSDDTEFVDQDYAPAESSGGFGLLRQFLGGRALAVPP